MPLCRVLLNGALCASVRPKRPFLFGRGREDIEVLRDEVELDVDWRMNHRK